MMIDLGYYESLDKLGQLKRPGLRKEWSFFFDCITRAFQKKSTNWDAIPMDMLQIGYSLIYSTAFDFGRLVLRNIGERMHENRQVIYFSRFCQLLFNATVGEVDFDAADEINLLNFIKGFSRISYLKMRRDQFSDLCIFQLH
uniref:Uncharacterized protein n=1 Tax=Daucus carota subsp. sativus TaxID=79200 RepID=A0A165A9X8_DAUCS